MDNASHSDVLKFVQYNYMHTYSEISERTLHGFNYRLGLAIARLGL